MVTATRISNKFLIYFQIFLYLGKSLSANFFFNPGCEGLFRGVYCQQNQGGQNMLFFSFLEEEKEECFLKLLIFNM